MLSTTIDIFGENIFMDIECTGNQLFSNQRLNATFLASKDTFSTLNDNSLRYSSRSSYQESNIFNQESLINSFSTNPSTQDWFSDNIADIGLQEIVRSLGSDGILDRDDMLAIFTDNGLTDDSIIDVTEQADLRNLISNANLFAMPDYVDFLSVRVVEGIYTDMSACDFNSSLVSPWFLGSLTPTDSFNDTNLTFIEVEGSLFGDSGTPQIGDIDQGYFGDCSFLAALGATFSPQFNDADNQSSSIIESMIIDNGDNTYTIRFYDNYTPQWVTVDRRLPFDAETGEWYGASANGSTDPNNPGNVLWAPLVERAYAQWREWQEGSNGYDLIGNGDDLYRPLGFVTGRTTYQFGEGGSDGSFSTVAFSDIQNLLSYGYSVEVGRYNQSDTTYIVGSHAYSLTNAYTDDDGEQRVVVRNPWGVDGKTVQGDDDGFIDLSFSEFQSFFDSIAYA